MTTTLPQMYQNQLNILNGIDSNNMSPFLKAVYDKDFSGVESQISAETAVIGDKNSFGHSAMMLAVFRKDSDVSQNNLKILDLLMANSKDLDHDLNLKDSNNFSILDVAFLDIYNQLIEAINKKNNSAVIDWTIFEKLIDKGINSFTAHSALPVVISQLISLTDPENLADTNSDSEADVNDGSNVDTSKNLAAKINVELKKIIDKSKLVLDTNEFNTFGIVALFNSIVLPDSDIFDYLIAQNVSIATTHPANGKTIIFAAMEANNIAILEKIKNLNITIDQRIYNTDNNFPTNTPLLQGLGSIQVRTATIKKLLELNADPILTGAGGKNGLQNYLIRPDIGFNEDIFQTLLSKTIIAGKLEHQDYFGNTALYLSLDSSDNNGRVTALLNAGADVNKANNEGKTPLHYAALTLNKLITQLLIDKSAQVNAVNTLDNNATALHYAIKDQDYDNKSVLEVIEILLASGADINAQTANDPNRDDSGFSALHYAAKIGSLDVAKYLIAQGADTELKAADVNTLLFWQESPLDMRNDFENLVNNNMQNNTVESNNTPAAEGDTATPSNNGNDSAANSGNTDSQAATPSNNGNDSEANSGSTDSQAATPSNNGNDSAANSGSTDSQAATPSDDGNDSAANSGNTDSQAATPSNNGNDLAAQNNSPTMPNDDQSSPSLMGDH